MSENTHNIHITTPHGLDAAHAKRSDRP